MLDRLVDKVKLLRKRYKYRSKNELEFRDRLRRREENVLFKKIEKEVKRTQEEQKQAKALKEEMR